MRNRPDIGLSLMIMKVPFTPSYYHTQDGFFQKIFVSVWVPCRSLARYSLRPESIGAELSVSGGVGPLGGIPAGDEGAEQRKHPERTGGETRLRRETRGVEAKGNGAALSLWGSIPFTVVSRL